MLKTTNYFHFHLIRLKIEFPLPVEEDLLQEKNLFPEGSRSAIFERTQDTLRVSVAGNLLPRSGVSYLVVTRPTREKVVAEN